MPLLAASQVNIPAVNGRVLGFPVPAGWVKHSEILHFLSTPWDGEFPLLLL